MVKLEDLRSYTGHKVTSLQIGQVVKYDGGFWVVEAQAIGECVLAPIVKDSCRDPITIA